MPRFSIVRCSDNASLTGGTVQSFRDTNVVYKVNNVCYRVTGLLSGNALPGDISLDNVQNSYSGNNACVDCLYSINPTYNCVNGQCTPAGAGNQFQYSSLSSCQSNCTPPTTPWIYILRDCNNQQVGTAYHNTNGGLGNRGILINGQCRRLDTPFQNSNIPQGSINITASTTFDNACPTCSNNTPPPPPPPAVPKKYLFQQCSGTTTVIGYRDQGDLNIGSAIIIYGNCFTVTSIFGNMNDPGQNLTNALTCTCSTPPGGGGGGTGGGTGPGGGGGGGFGGVAGGQGVGTNGSDGDGPSSLLTGYRCLNNQCQSYLYDPATGEEPQFTSLSACQASGCETPPPSGYNCTLNGCTASTLGAGQYATMQLCQNACKNWNCVTGQGCVKVSSPGTGTYKTQIECGTNCQGFTQQPETIYQCTLRNCANPNDQIIGWKTTFQNPGPIYRFNQTSLTWKCYTLVSIIGTSTPTTNQGGVNLEGKPTYQDCEDCLPEEMPLDPTGSGPGEGPVCCFVGDTQVAMADGNYCQIKDVKIGAEVKTTSGKIAKVIDKITPIIGDRGLLSINNGKAFATPDHIFKSTDGLWLTANIELSRKSFRAFDEILKNGGIIKQLSIGDYIITESGPVLIETFEITNSGIFDDTVVYDLQLDNESDHTYFVDSYAAHNCSPEDPPFCVQFPDHPTCSPCYNTPCAVGCPLDCTQCPNDPRCQSDPCENVIEPAQGDLLTTWYSGPPVNMLPDAFAYNWMIDDCWKWKYCVCRSQPDSVNDPDTYEFRVCLCGEQVEDYTNPCPAAGAFIRYECKNSSNTNSPIKLEKWGVYTNGSCGEYSQLIEQNSAFCGATTNPSCTQTGTLIRTYCVNLDKYGEYHDGNCGKYIERIEVNSKGCGYVDPPPPPPPPPPKVEVEPPLPVAARVYYPIRTEDTLTSVDITSFALWSNDTSFLLTPSTQSIADTSSFNYILSVYDKSPDSSPTCSAELQYNIIYGDYEGKGATDLGGYDNYTLTKAMYTQYAHVLLPHGQQKFNFNGEDEDYVYIIDIARKRFRQSLDPGNWEITFASSSFSFESGSHSILQNMHTASYKNLTLSLVDSLAKKPDSVKPVYLSSKPYDVYVGTLEDGIGTNFVTASITSRSLATVEDTSYISTPVSSTAQTVIVRGARAYYFGIDGTVHYRVIDGTGSRIEVTSPTNIKNVQPDVTMTAAYRMTKQETVSSEYGFYLVKYAGSFTGSFALPIGATLTPTVISGSCVTEIYYDNSYNLQPVPASLQWIEGFTFNPKQDAFTGAGKQTLTVNSVTYEGRFKWGAYSHPIGNLFAGPLTFNTASLNGSFTGSVNLAFVTDDWGIQEYIEDPTDPLTDFSNFEDLDNGSILLPVKRTVYGQVFPSHGIIVLSGKKLDELVGLNTNRSIDKNGYNTYRLYHSMKLILDRGLTDLSGDKLAFYARGVDIKRSSRYFITLKNSHLNYSNNPTYVSGSEGDIIGGFIRQNKAYFSSVGLYNNEKELLAIGKVSKPIMSSLTDEMLFTVKITQ